MLHPLVPKKDSFYSTVIDYNGILFLVLLKFKFLTKLLFVWENNDIWPLLDIN